MKCFVALVALVAAVSAESNIINPWTTPYGFNGISPYHGYGATPFTGFNRGMVPFGGMSPFLHQQHQRVFKREAESDSDSFYPGYPYAPVMPYGSPYGSSYGTPYGFPGVHQPVVSPYYGQRQVYATHPFMYNPVLKTVEEQKPVAHKVEKRESESDSFYPGFPYMHHAAARTPYFGHQMPYYNTPMNAPVASPVLPYAFNGYYNRPVVRVIKPVENKYEVESQ